MKKLITLFSLVFSLSTVFGAITINPSTIDTAYCQHTYSFKCTATGGVAPYQYTISVGSLPTGVFLNKTTGQITSTNVNYTAATSVAFTVRATDATGATGTRAYTMYIVNYPATWSYIWPKFKNMPNAYPTNADAYDGWRLFATGNPTDLYWGIGGNTITAAKKLGSLDAFDVNLVTNNTTRATVYGNGNGVNITTSLYVGGNKMLYIPGGASGNTSLGASAGNSQTSSSFNTNVGSLSLTANTTGDDITATGYSSFRNNTTGSDNTGNGFEAGKANTTGSQNTHVGSGAGKTSTTASATTLVGYNAGALNTAADITAIGSGALDENTSGTGNLAAGKNAVGANTTGTGNVGVGDGAVGSVVTGTDNTGIGYRVLRDATGVSNTGGGKFSLLQTTTGGNNTAWGMQSGFANTAGSNNTFLGYNAGETFPTTASGNTVAGAGISPRTNADDWLVIGAGGTRRIEVDGSGVFRLNGPAVTAKAAEPSTHVITINIDGTTYYLLATNVAP